MSKAVMLRVGASADGSLSTVFDPLPVSARKAAAQVTRELNKVSASMRAESAKTTAVHAKEAAAQARIFQKRDAADVASAAAAAKERERVTRREFDARLRESQRAANEKRRIADAEVRAAIRAANTIERAEEQASKRKERERGRAGRERYGTLSRVGGAIGSAARTGIDMGRNVLSGMGLDLDVGSHLKKAVDVDKTTRAIANSTALSQNRAVTQADNEAVSGVIHKTGDSAKIDYGEVAGGLDEFVKRSADFKLAKQIFGELGEIAQATGTDFGALAGAAGEIATKLPDTEHKAKDLLDTITAFAGAGAKGSIELSDMAEFLNVLAGGAMKVAGSRVEALEQMNAVAQVARQGGKIDPAEATRSANALMRDLTKGANLKRFEKAGIDPFSDKSHTELKSPKEMIKTFMRETGGDLGKLAKLLPNEMSRAAVEAFGDIYKTKGEKGIDEKFAELTSGLTPEAMKGAASNAKGGDAAKIVEANNKISMSMARLVPEIEKLIPAVTKGAEFLSSNLGTVVTLAIAGSLAKAALGDVVKNALTNAFGGGGKGGVPGAPGGGAMGTLAGGLAIAAGLYVVGRALIDSDLGKLNKAGDDRRATEFALGDDRVNAFNKDPKVRKEAREGIQNHIAELDQKIKLGEEYRTGSSFFRSATGVNRFAGWANDVNPEWGQSTDSQAVGKDASEHLGDLWLERKKAGFDLRNSERLEAKSGSTLRAEAGGSNGAANSAKALEAAAGVLGASGIEGGAALMQAAAQLSAAAAQLGASGGGGGGNGVNPAGRH
jgi:hypothetical protein